MNHLEASKIIDRVIAEVAGTIRTNGIQELDHEQRGGMSTYLYVVDCLVATAYNAVRALPGFALSYGEFHARATAPLSESSIIGYLNRDTVIEQNGKRQHVMQEPTASDRGTARAIIAEMEKPQRPQDVPGYFDRTGPDGQYPSRT